MLYCIGKFIRKRKLSDLGFDNFFGFDIIMIEDRRGVVMKIRKSIFIVLALVGFLFLPSRVQALDLKLTYNEKLQKCFDDLSVLPSYDNNGEIDGLLYLDSNGITKQDLNNKIVYDGKEKDVYTVDVSTIRSSNSDGYMVEGEADLLITAYNDDDSELFKTQYGGDGVDYGIMGMKSYNNKGVHDGYLVFFLTNSSEFTDVLSYFMLKIDLNGNVRWEKNINEFIRGTVLFTKNKMAFAVEKTDDSYSVLSITNIYENEVILNVDTGIFINNINYSYDKNGKIDGFVVVGYVYSNGYTAEIIKYDFEGNEIFRSSYDKTDAGTIYYDVISSYLPDGSYDGYIVTGVTADAEGTKTVILKYDYTGKKNVEMVYSQGTFGGKVFNNYDVNKKQNGYLMFFSQTKDFMAMKVQESIDTYDITVCKDLMVAKYTYDNYPVVKENSEEGTISVKSDAYPGEVVKINVTVKEGYSLKRIIVKDENGNEIEVNGDGTFIMPEGKVTVSAIYNRIVNPDTVSACYIVLGIILVIALGSTIVMREKNKEKV